MKSSRLKSLSPAFFFISDLIALNAAFFVAISYRFDDKTPLNEIYYDYYIQLYVLLNAVWIALYTYSVRRPSHSNFTDISNSFNKRWLFLIIVYSLLVVSLKGYYYSRIFAFIFFFSLLFFGNIFIFITSRISKKYLSSFSTHRYIVIGDISSVNKITDKLTSSRDSLINIVPIISDKPEEALEQFSHQNITAVLSTYRDAESLKSVQSWCDQTFVPHYIALYEFSDMIFFADIFYDFGIQMLKIRDEPLSTPLNQLLKRGFDIVVSLVIGIFILIPSIIICLILLAYWKKSPFYCQKRYGQTGKIFTIYKFRTIDRNHSPVFCQLLRKYSIDEWPQFINVLKGEMSVIGPRPYHLADVSYFKNKSKNFMVRYWVKPGITGLAQIRGYRGKIENEYHYQERLKNDVWYIENWSLTLDIKILILSLFRILKGDGI